MSAENRTNRREHEQEFTEVVRNRYSCKNFDAGKAVDAAKLTEILEAGRVAPTAKIFRSRRSM